MRAEQQLLMGSPGGSIPMSHARVLHHLMMLFQIYTPAPLFAYQVEQAPRKSLVAAQEEPALERDLLRIRVLDRIARLIHPCRLALRLFVFLFALKELFYVVAIHFHFGIFQKDPVKLEHYQNQTIHSIACIKSNCSHLFEDLKVGRMSSKSLVVHLPIFAICFPSLTNLYEPCQHQFVIGHAILATVVIYDLLVDVGVFGISPHGRAGTDSLLLFLVAPNVAHKKILERAEMHLRQLRYSYLNFLEMKRLKRMSELESSAPSRVLEVGGLDEQKHALKHSMTSSLVDTSFIMRFKLLDKSVRFKDGSLMDCMPLIRTACWHRILTNFETIIVALFYLTILIMALIFIYYFNYQNGLNMKGFTRLEEYFDRVKCNIWLKESSLTDVGIGLNFREKYDYQFSLLTFIPFFFCFVIWPLTWGMLAFNNVLISGWELRYWACELRYKLTMVCPLIRDLFVWPDKQLELEEQSQQQQGSKVNKALNLKNNLYRAHREPDQVFRFDRFRAQFASEVSASMLLVRHKSLKSFRSQADNLRALGQNYYFEPVRHEPHPNGDPEANLAELLEKFYIELRLMNELRVDIEMKISLVTISIVCANYLTSLFCVYTFKLLQSFRLEMIAMLLSGQLATTILIFNSVSLCSQVRKLSPLINSILADLSQARTGQLQHIRSLFLRMRDDIELTKAPNGGPTRSFHLTYVTMIQFIFTVLTMFLFVLKT